MDMSRVYASERGLADLRLHIPTNTPRVPQFQDTLYRQKERDMIEWEERLSVTERAILKVARDMYFYFPMDGGCYHLSFFLACYLRDRFGVNGQAEVGFVNDGTNTLYPSHAWYVLDDRITDLAISRPVNPLSNWCGPLIMFGQEIAPGWRYSYHTESSPKGAEIIRGMSDYAILPPSRKLHIKMSAISRSYLSMRAYLSNATKGYTYDEMARRLESL